MPFLDAHMSKMTSNQVRTELHRHRLRLVEIEPSGDAKYARDRALLLLCPLLKLAMQLLGEPESKGAVVLLCHCTDSFLGRHHHHRNGIDAVMATGGWRVHHPKSPPRYRDGDLRPQGENAERPGHPWKENPGRAALVK